MKKFLLFTSFTFFGMSAFAQPTIQSSDFYPSIGESFIFHESDTVHQGPAGNNVTWDLSGFVSNDILTVKILGPDSNYPGATHNIEYVGKSNLHTDLSTNDFLIVGEEASGAEINYTTPKKMYQLPMTMGTSFVNNFSGTVASGGVTLNRTGTFESEVDGYGTLITPAGTFTDVLRVHSLLINEDDAMGQTITTTFDTYRWFKAGVHLELAYIQTVTTPGGVNYFANYLESTLNLNDNSMIHPLVLYPNPAQDNVTINYDSTIDKIEVIDLNGRSIDVEFNPTNKTIDVSSLNAGIYYVSVYTDNNKSIQKLIIN